MSATNPLPPASPAGGEGRPHEPSMEEILASIRRIIADDQSLPPHHSEPDNDARGATPPVPSGERLEASVHLLRNEAGSLGRARVAPFGAEGSSVEPASPATAGSDATAIVGAAASDKPDGDSSRATISAPQFPSPPAPVDQKAFEVEDVDAPATGESVEPTEARDPDRRSLAAERDADDYFDPPTEYDRPAAEASPSLFSAATNSSVSSAFNMLAASRIADNSEELMGLAREMIRPLLKSWLDDNMPSMVERMVREEIERVARGGH